jgi:hypothetical protein
MNNIEIRVVEQHPLAPSNQVALDRDWFDVGDTIYFNNIPIKIKEKGTVYYNKTWYELDTQIIFKVGDTFTYKLEQQNEKPANSSITINININIFPTSGV